MLNDLTVRLVKSDEDGTPEAISISIPLKDSTTINTMVGKCTSTPVPNTKFSVDFSLFKNSLISKTKDILADLTANTKYQLTEDCSWCVTRKNVLVITISTSAFLEVLSSGAVGNLSVVYTVKKRKLGSKLHFFLTVFAPPGYLSSRYRPDINSVSPDPRPLMRASPLGGGPGAVRDEEDWAEWDNQKKSDVEHYKEPVIRRLRLSSSSDPSPSSQPDNESNTAYVTRATTATNASSGFIGILQKRPSLPASGQDGDHGIHGAVLYENCFSIDDTKRTDVILHFIPEKHTESNFTASGTILSDMGYNLALQYAPLPSSSVPPAAMDEDEHLFLDGVSLADATEVADVYNVKAFIKEATRTADKVGISNSTYQTLEIHFDSTKARPTITKQQPSHSISRRVGFPGLSNRTNDRRRSAIVAECKGWRFGDYLIDFCVVKSIKFPREDEVCRELKRYILDDFVPSTGALPPLDFAAVERYMEKMESHYQLLFQLSEEEIEEFQMLVWSCLRNCVYDSAKLICVPTT